RRAAQARENLERVLAALRLAPPAAVEYRELRFVSRRQRYAVEQLAPQHAERLPVFLHLDEHPVAHRRGAVGGRSEEVGDGVARSPRRGGRSALGEHREPLEVEDVARHLSLLRGRGWRGRRGGHLTRA